MTELTRYPKNTTGKDHNKFARILVDGYEFDQYADFVFNIRNAVMTFSLVNEGAGTIEYSFNGNTVHGDLTVGTPTEAIFFDNRKIMAIWFRARGGEGFGSIVRVEGWAIP